jgi:hypothetical protein
VVKSNEVEILEKVRSHLAKYITSAILPTLIKLYLIDQTLKNHSSKPPCSMVTQMPQIKQLKN